MGNFVYHDWKCLLIYRPLFYPLDSWLKLVVKKGTILLICISWKYFNLSSIDFPLKSMIKKSTGYVSPVPDYEIINQIVNPMCDAVWRIWGHIFCVTFTQCAKILHNTKHKRFNLKTVTLCFGQWHRVKMSGWDIEE